MITCFCIQYRLEIVSNHGIFSIGGPEFWNKDPLLGPSKRNKIPLLSGDLLEGYVECHNAVLATHHQYLCMYYS